MYFEDPRRDIIDVTGARHVVLRSSGFASMRITVALTVTAAGMRLLVIWKGKGEKVEKRGGVYAALQEHAWEDSSLLTKWIDIVFSAVLDAYEVSGLMEPRTNASRREPRWPSFCVAT